MLTSAHNIISKILLTKIINSNNTKLTKTTHSNKRAEFLVMRATSLIRKTLFKSSNRGWRKRVAYKTWAQASVINISKHSNFTTSTTIVLLWSMKLPRVIQMTSLHRATRWHLSMQMLTFWTITLWITLTCVRCHSSSRPPPVITHGACKQIHRLSYQNLDLL